MTKIIIKKEEEKCLRFSFFFPSFSYDISQEARMFTLIHIVIESTIGTRLRCYYDLDYLDIQNKCLLKLYAFEFKFRMLWVISFYKCFEILLNEMNNFNNQATTLNREEFFIFYSSMHGFSLI